MQATSDQLQKRFNQADPDVRHVPLLDDQRLSLAEGAESLPLARTGKVFRVEVGARRMVKLSGTVGTIRGESEKAGILQFVFLDASDSVIEGPYAFGTWSDTAGNYMYLAASKAGTPFNVKMVTPDNACALLLGFRLWDTKLEVSVSDEWVFEDDGPYVSPEDYASYYEQFFDTAASSDSDLVAFLYASTKLIGHSHRGNRSMRFGRLMADRGIPIIYNYYRWNEHSDMVPWDGGALFQSPIDMTIRKMVDIATHPFPGKKKLLILSFPNSDAVKHIGLFKKYGWTVIYECRDDWEEFWLAGAGKWYDPLFERYVVSKADAVCTVSCTLRDKMAKWRLSGQSEPVIIPNGLEPSFLEKPTGEFVETRRLQSSRVVIGYHGHLTAAWFDWQLLVDTAREHPEWEFEIIGFDGPDDLDMPENMRQLGPRSHEEINEIAQRWTVGIIPFIPSKLAEGVDPIKVYEYLAMGLPVVSVLMPQILEYPHVRCYRERGEFADMVAAAAAEEVDVAVIEEFLRTRTWDDRIDQTLRLMEEVLGDAQS